MRVPKKKIKGATEKSREKDRASSTGGGKRLGDGEKGDGPSVSVTMNQPSATDRYCTPRFRLPRAGPRTPATVGPPHCTDAMGSEAKSKIHEIRRGGQREPN